MTTPIDAGLAEALNQTGTATESTNRATAPKKDAFGQDAFLTLMITQLKNQNPLEPLKNQEFLAQLSQFTTASGVQDLQKSFDSLSSALQSNQALQASSLVGRKVVIESGIGNLSGMNGMTGIIDVPNAVGNLRVSIFDNVGSLIKTIDLGMQQAGQTRFTWDGRDDAGHTVASGNYRFTAEANFNGTSYSFNTFVESTVESVTLGRNGQGMVLNLGGLGSVSMADVQQIR